jgi:hypothetical protein
MCGHYALNVVYTVYYMSIVRIFWILIVVAAGSAAIFLLWRTYVSEHSLQQEKFRRGRADIGNLEGEYRGYVSGYSGSWQGKVFNQATSRGVNRFQEGTSVVDNYPFKISVGKGVPDPELDVIKIDYNQPGNPWWLRFVLDEIVGIAPNTYLGKIHLVFSPRISFTVGYFTLEK